jgi:hypothetical protein
MKSKTEVERLLDDIFSDAAPEPFRTQLLEVTLRRARVHRRISLARRTAAVALLVVTTVGLWGWREVMVSDPLRQAKVTVRQPVSGLPSYGLIRTLPTEPARLIATTPGTTPVVLTAPASVAVVATQPEQRLFSEINDDQLLMLLAERPAVLVRRGPHDAELVVWGKEVEDPVE